MTRSLTMLVICALMPAEGRAQALADNLRMQKVVRQFVKETGREVVGVGSWINGAYRVGFSDHDLRIVMPQGTAEADAARAWQESQARLKVLIQEEFGPQAESVLSRTNVYAPTQMMKGVEDASDALSVYQGANRVPNLAYRGTVTKQTPAKFIEGLYGPGSQTWTQAYEKTSGRVFYRQGNSVYSGLTDLTHLSEGTARYTAAGMGNTTAQWAEKATDAMAHGDVQSLSKYIERLERDLAKGKDLARFRLDPAFQQELRSLSNALKPNAAGRVDSAAYRQLRARVVAAVERGAKEAAILRQAQRAAGNQRALLQAILDDFTKKTYLSDLIGKAAEKIPFDKVLSGLMVYMAVKSGAQAAGEEGVMAGLLAAAPWMASLPVGLLTELTRAVLKEAEAAGIRFVTSSQDPWDLMAGVYTVVGRAGAEAGRGYTLDQLVRLFWNEERLKSIVFWKCRLATARNLGQNPDAVDARAAEDLYNRVWPVIQQAWEFEREKLRLEYFELLQELQRSPLILTYKPEPALLPSRGGVLVTMSAASLDRDGGRRVDRIREILGILGGKDVYAQGRYDWPGGAEQPAPWARQFRFERPGVYPVVCKYVLLTGGTAFGANSPMMRITTIFAGVDVEVVGQEPEKGGGLETAKGPGGKPAAAAKGTTWVLQPNPVLEENNFKNQDKRITGGANFWAGDFTTGMVTMKTAWANGPPGTPRGPGVSPILLQANHSWNLPERMTVGEPVLVPMKISSIVFTWVDPKGSAYTLGTRLDLYQPGGGQVIGSIGKGVNGKSPDVKAPAEVTGTGKFTPPPGRPGDTFTIIAKVQDGGSTYTQALLVYKLE